MSDPLRLVPLGGLGEIGMNMMVVESGNDRIVIDCGLMFPLGEMPGVDIVLPNIGYLRGGRKRRKTLKAVLLTHGHEDHIGAIPFLADLLKPPVIYGTPLTLGLLRSRLSEFGLENALRLLTVEPGRRFTIGPFAIEAIRVHHSIPDGVGYAIETPQGLLVHSGDFKHDPTPVGGRVIDFERFRELGERGVRVLLADSTNVEREGHTLSEEEIKRRFIELFPTLPGRIVVSMFASNIERMQNVVEAAGAVGRKILLNGRSIVTNARIARDLGYLRIPPGLEIQLEELDYLPPGEVVILTTGSQGEPFSGLMRMAMGEHRGIKIHEGDTVILSSRFIPGNERAIGSMINHLYRRGANVIYEKVASIHTSGHAYRDELRMMIRAVRPEHFIPIHGEYRHLVEHARLAGEEGVSTEKCLVGEDGDVFEFDGNGGGIKGRVEAGRIFVDGKGIGDVEEYVLRDRQQLGEDGFLVVSVVINRQTGQIISGPDLITRGFLAERDAASLLEEAKGVVVKTLDAIDIEAKTDPIEASELVRRAVRRFFKKRIERRPVVVPILIEM